MRNDCSVRAMLGTALALAALAASGCAKSEPVAAEAEEIEQAVTEANDAAASVQRNRSGS